MTKAAVARAWQLPDVGGRRYSDPANEPSAWPVNDPSYLSLIPNGAGFGMDSVFGASTSATVFLINDLSLSSSSTTLYTGIVECTLGYYLDLTSNDRFGLLTRSGLGDHRVVRSLYGDRVTLSGVVAPSPGTAFHNLRIRMKGSDQLIDNLSNYVGREAWYGGSGDYWDVENRDGIEFGPNWDDDGGTAWSSPKVRQVGANLTIVGALDEGGEFYGASDQTTLWQCLLTHPLQYGKSGGVYSAGEEHACGTIVGDLPTKVSLIRCLIQHGNYRMPVISRGNSLSVIDCLTYNAGSNDSRYSWNEWAALSGNLRTNDNYPGTGLSAVATRANFIGNGFVVGPNTYVKAVPITTGHSVPTFQTGSGIYLLNNRTHGFTGGSDTDQTNLLLEEGDEIYVGSLITAVYPDGYNSYALQTGTPALTDFAQLLGNTAGARTKDRAAGIDAYAAFHTYNRLVGSGPEGEIINGLDEINDYYAAGGSGGIPTFAANSVNVFDSGAMDGDPLSTSISALRTVQASGYTGLGEWYRRKWMLRNNY